LKTTNTNLRQDLLLGQQTEYPRSYSPDVLQPIPRSLGRETLPFGVNISRGFDCWHLYELSWLDASNKPQVAIARLMIPADSPNIVESKSLKLYCNSLNFSQIASHDDVAALLKRDIGKVVKATITVDLFAVDEQHVNRLRGHCIDDYVLPYSTQELSEAVAQGKRQRLLTHANSTTEDTATVISMTADDTASSEQPSEPVSEILYSHLLRSNCPVTNQPDWGSLLLRYEGRPIDRAALLGYLCTYREHNGFHEQCIEQIYADIWTQLKPTTLLVQAWYTRRGGIDINPCRASDAAWLPEPSRLARQ